MTPDPQEHEAPNLISDADAASLLGLSRRTLSDLAMAGYLRAETTGTSLQFAAAEVLILSLFRRGGRQ